MAKDGAVYLTYADLPYVNADMTNIVDRGDRYVKEGVPDVDGSGTLHWSDDVRINNDATTTDQWNPSIAISPDGNTIFVGYCSLPSRPSRGDGQPVGCREQWCEDAVPMVSERGARPDGLIPGATNVVYEAKPASTTTYRVKITNQAGETVSAPATVTVVAHLPSLDFAWVAGKPVDTVHAAAGVTVQVERSEDPVAGPWTSVGEVVTTGDSVTLVNIAAPASDARFYRALVVRWHCVTRHSPFSQVVAGRGRAPLSRPASCPCGRFGPRTGAMAPRKPLKALMGRLSSSAPRAVLRPEVLSPILRSPFLADYFLETGTYAWIPISQSLTASNCSGQPRINANARE